FTLACVRRAWPVEALMLRRQLLETTALAVAGAMAGGLSAPKTAAGQQTAPSSATKRPIRILMVGYGPPSTGFSLALKRIGDRLGQVLAAKLEAGMNCRVLGYFEAAFTHFSNRLRPIRTPADIKGMRMRVRPSKVQARTFELLGAEPKAMDLSEFIEAVKAGSVDAQENAFANTVTYGVHKFHRFHSATNQCYVSRPVFVHRPSFDAWP